MKVNIKIYDLDLIKYLKNKESYINEYGNLLDKQFELLYTNNNKQNKKEIRKIYKRLSELVVIIEFLEAMEEN